MRTNGSAATSLPALFDRQGSSPDPCIRSFVVRLYCHHTRLRTFPSPRSFSIYHVRFETPPSSRRGFRKPLLSPLQCVGKAAISPRRLDVPLMRTLRNQEVNSQMIYSTSRFSSTREDRTKEFCSWAVPQRRRRKRSASQNCHERQPEP